MRLSVGGSAKRGRARLDRALANSRERLRRVRTPGHGRRGRVRTPGRGPRERVLALAGGLATRGEERLGRAVAKHGSERVARVLIIALVLLTGSGTAAALAVLPSDGAGAGAGAGAAAVAGGTAAAGQTHRFAVGWLEGSGPQPRRAGPAYYAKTASKRVPVSTGSGFLPLYREAAETFGVSWRLIASIHRQETAFSTAPTTYHGLNPFGCCAGPMQFNVTNGPPSTWALYRQSFRQGDRPRRYPHPTRHHPSIYDDFDAIMAAGALLRDSGAGASLDGGSWSAAYAYYGHDLFGIDYASQVLARARGWERDGFCVNCPVDGALVAEYDDAYGVDARRVLLADERREKEEKRKKKRQEERARKRRAEARRKAAEKREAEREERRRAAPPARPDRDADRAPTTTTPQPPPATTTTTPTTTTDTPPPPPPPPPPPDCTGLKKLLGCG